MYVIKTQEDSTGLLRVKIGLRVRLENCLESCADPIVAWTLARILAEPVLKTVT